jgi:hypothetical protein
MLSRSPVVVTSVEPLEGEEGTIVTLKGSGFAAHNRNNCVVLGGMGACARAEGDSTPTELRVRVGPIAKATAGDLLMWPGATVDLHLEAVNVGRTSLHFSEAAIFRNAAPVAAAGINFKLTKASPNTYSASIEKLAASGSVDLGGHEGGSAMLVRFSREARTFQKVDICCVLKEPTVAIDFTANISGPQNSEEECLRAIAKSISVNAGLVGEKVFADVLRDQQTGGFELYVTKPYLTNGMITLHFRE